MESDRPPVVKPADVREAAIRLLARREHSVRELERKLGQRGWPSDMIDTVIGELAEQGLQSDDRFAEVFVRSRSQKAYGPIRIRAELNERGIDRSLAERALRQSEIDWLDIAVRWYQRRYGDAPVIDLKEKSRRQQSMARRGFDHSLITEVI